MTSVAEPIPPWPGAGKPRLRAAFVAAVSAAAARADWVAVTDALRDVPPKMLPPGLAAPFIAAGLHDDRPGVLSAAVAATAEADIPARLRVALAWRLAGSDRPHEAWTALHADPATMADPSAYAAITQLLAAIMQSTRAAPELRAAASALMRRYTNLADLEPVAAPYAFADGPLDPRPGTDPRILVAPGVPPAVVGAYRTAITSFLASLTHRSQPDVRELSDVFVNRLGQVWLPDGRIVFNRRQPLPPASRAAMQDAPSIAEGVLAAETHQNLFHWLADWLPSLAWRFEPGAPDIPIITRDDAAPFVIESLRLAGGNALPIMRAGDALRVGRLFVGALGAGRIAPLGAHRRLFETLGAAVDAAPAPPGGTARRLYVSRRDSTKRRLHNEAAVEAALAARGFHAVTFTGMPYAEQVGLVRGAEVIAAPHGAGLSHVLLARPGTAVFEIMPGSLVGAQLTTCMARLSRLMGLRHTIWLEMNNSFAGHWTADLPAMLPALDAFLHEQPAPPAPCDSAGSA
jgi:hypothetical protein